MFGRARTFNTMQNVTHELGHWIDQRGGKQARADLKAAMDKQPFLTRSAGGFAEGNGWVQNQSGEEGEVFGDMFLGWVYGKWSRQYYNAGVIKARYMEDNIINVISLSVNMK